jgi:hypothetical protein
MITLPIMIINGGVASPPAEIASTKVIYLVLVLLGVNSFFVDSLVIIY